MQHLTLDVTTWTDNNISAGNNWRKSIDDAIRESFITIAIISELANKSQFVTYEWSFAMGIGTSKVIPILLEQTQLHPKLEEIEYLDFTTRYAEEWNKLEQVIRHTKEQFDVYTQIPNHIQLAKMALQSWNPFERFAGVKTINDSNHIDAIDDIIPFLEDSAWEVRQEVVDALGKFGDARAIEPLKIRLNSDADWRVRGDSLEALVKIGGLDAIPIAIEALNDENKHVQRNAIEALMQFGTPEALEAIKNINKD